MSPLPAVAPIVESELAIPSISAERSRTQVLCRSGYKGKTQSFSIKYGDGSPYATEAGAIAIAEKWLRDERKLQWLN